MNKKKCFKCKDIKCLDEFYAHPDTKDGYLNKCKSCTKIDSRKNSKTLTTRQREKLRNSTEKRKLHLSKVSKNWRKNNPEKYHAQNKVSYALRIGIITKPSCCEKCSSNSKLHAHHEDYSKPLDVTWLCVPCHGKKNPNYSNNILDTQRRKMKAITLTQPWATLVAIGAKKIETRSWNTNYRGKLAIHAAAGKYVDDYLLMKIEPFYTALKNAGIESRLQIPLGGVIATCDLVSTHKVDEMDWIEGKRGWSKDNYFWGATDQEKSFGDYSVGRYMWFLANVNALENPIPVRGSLGLWEWDTYWNENASVKLD